jgi:hypothetical protein
MRRSRKIEKLVEEALSIQNNWLEDVLAGLLINGVSKDRIKIERQSFSPNSIKVYVDGIMKYSFQHIFS